jgi:dihydrofolate reductase
MAGPDQSIDQPLGKDGPKLHEWVFATRSGREMRGDAGGEEGIDDEFVAEEQRGIRPTIMGRNMFGPVRGPWANESWTGWWGDEPPFHYQVFVLTHHPRASLTMQGGTTFHFVDADIESVLECAFEAADGNDVRLGGGVATIQQYLRARLIDEMHLVIVLVLLGRGERLLDGPSVDPAAYKCVQMLASSSVMHARFVKSAPEER